MRVTDRAANSLVNEKVQSSTPDAVSSTKPELSRLPENAQSIKASQQNAISRMGDAVLAGQMYQTLASSLANRLPNSHVLRQASTPGMPLSEFSGGLQRLLERLGDQPESEMAESFSQIETMLNLASELSLSPEMDVRTALDIVGSSAEAENILHNTISNAPQEATGMPSDSENPFMQILQQFAAMLAGLQGRPGQQPLGYPAGAFQPKDGTSKMKEANVAADQGGMDESSSSGGEVRQELLDEAKKLRAGGGLTKPEDSKQPKLSEADQKYIDALIAKADDGGAEAISNDPKLLAKLSPEQKAKLIRQLMDGSTDGSEECSIARIMGSVNSKAEWDQVLHLSGGHKVFEELENDQAKTWFREHESKWNKAQGESGKDGISLLEKCKTPEEAKQVAAELGGLDFKNQIKDPELLKRLDAVAKRFNMPALGYDGIAPEVVKQKRDEINQAAVKEDSALAVKLSEDRDAMKVATPTEKAKLIVELQRGWTKDSQDAAINRILKSCTSKEEFDEVVKLAGGPAILKDMDFEESRVNTNRLYGAWDRTDMADDKAEASKYQGVLADPEKKAKYTSTRKPTEAELSQVDGSHQFDPNDKDPLMQAGAKAKQTVDKNMQDKKYDIDWDPQSKNELALENRTRELNGKPMLDWTSLTAEADKVTSDPDFDKKVNEYAKQNDLDLKEAREKYVTVHMEALAKKHGLTEQQMKTLVTQRMGQIHTKGAEEMAGYSQAIVEPMKQQLAVIERTLGPNSPEANELRARIAKFDNATGAYAQHLDNVGSTYKSMFPVPPSFAEDFVNSFSFIADIAAGIASLIPGVGQVVGGVYFGVKAIVAAAKGDVLGMFSSVASVVPGLGSAIGGATGAAIKTGGNLVKAGIGVGTSIAEGNVVGALGGLTGMAGIAGIGGSATALNYAQTGIRTADGIIRGDAGAVFGAAGGMLGPLSSNPAVQGVVQNPIVQGVMQYGPKAVPFFNAIASGDMSKALSIATGELGPLVANNPDAARALQMVNDGAKFIEGLRTGDYSKALGGLITNQELLGSGPAAVAFTQAMSQSSNLLLAMGSGSTQQVVEALQGKDGVTGFLNGMTNSGLSESMSQVSSVADQFVQSHALQSVMDLTRSGSRFLGALGNGDLRAALNNVNGIDSTALSGMLAAGQPLIQSMMRGDYQRAIEELQKNPLTSGVADQLAMFNALAHLATGDWQKSLNAYHANLSRIAHVQNEVEQFQKLEESTRELQKRFGADIQSMAEYLIESSECPEQSPDLIAAITNPQMSAVLADQRTLIRYA